MDRVSRADSDMPSYPEYLAAKESVDASARNRSVWAQFVQSLEERGPALSLLEIGGGIGGTAMRILEDLEDLGLHRMNYTLVDSTLDNLSTAHSRLEEWARKREILHESSDTALHLSTDGTVAIQFVHDDLFTYADAASEQYDAIVAQSLLDLVPAEKALRILSPLLEEKGLWYLPLHYDGVTAFEPVIDEDLDETIHSLYNQSMNENPEQEGDGDGALTGRRLLSYLQSMDAPVLEVGPSDWILVPGGTGFTPEERTFLETILGFFETELTGHPEIDADRFDSWLTERRRQLAQDELIFITHQLDILAQKPDATPEVER